MRHYSNTPRNLQRMGAGSWDTGVWKAKIGDNSFVIIGMTGKFHIARKILGTYNTSGPFQTFNQVLERYNLKDAYCRQYVVEVLEVGDTFHTVIDSVTVAISSSKREASGRAILYLLDQQ